MTPDHKPNEPGQSEKELNVAQDIFHYLPVKTQTPDNTSAYINGVAELLSSRLRHNGQTAEEIAGELDEAQSVIFSCAKSDVDKALKIRRLESSLADMKKSLKLADKYVAYMDAAPMGKHQRKEYLKSRPSPPVTQEGQ